MNSSEPSIATRDTWPLRSVVRKSARERAFDTAGGEPRVLVEMEAQARCRNQFGVPSAFECYLRPPSNVCYWLPNCIVILHREWSFTFVFYPLPSVFQRRTRDVAPALARRFANGTTLLRHQRREKESTWGASSRIFNRIFRNKGINVSHGASSTRRVLSSPISRLSPAPDDSRGRSAVAIARISDGDRGGGAWKSDDGASSCRTHERDNSLNNIIPDIGRDGVREPRFISRNVICAGMNKNVEWKSRKKEENVEFAAPERFAMMKNEFKWRETRFIIYSRNTVVILRWILYYAVLSRIYFILQYNKHIVYNDIIAEREYVPTKNRDANFSESKLTLRNSNFYEVEDAVSGTPLFKKK